MFAIFSVTCPFFALVLLGYLATTRKLVPVESIPGLNSFVLYIALPCMLFRFGAQAQLSELLNARVIVLYCLAAVFMVSTALILTRRLGLNWNDASFCTLVGAFPNTGYIGIPMLIALCGPRATETAIISISIDMFFTTSLCLALSRIGDGGESNFSQVKGSLKAVVQNPLLWALALGVGVCAIHVELANVIDKTLELLSQATSPTALFLLGAVLGRDRLSKKAEPVFTEVDDRPAALWLICFFKLAIHPMLIFIFAKGLMISGWGIDPFSLKILILIASLPSASNVVMLAQRYLANSSRVAKIILYTTCASFFSFSILLKML